MEFYIKTRNLMVLISITDEERTNEKIVQIIGKIDID